MRRLFFLAVLSAVLTGCKTKYVAVIQTRTDTLRIVNHQRDSIWLHDSVMVSEKGDTVRIEKWHTKYVEKQVHDTLYQSKTDSIQQPYPVEVKVPRELSWWQKTQMYFGDIFMLLVSAGAAIAVIRKKLSL